MKQKFFVDVFYSTTKTVLVESNSKANALSDVSKWCDKNKIYAARLSNVRIADDDELDDADHDIRGSQI